MLKHGRIGMLASLGLLLQPIFHLPDPVFQSRLGYGAVTELYEKRPEAIWQILLAIAAIETFSLFKDGQGVAGDLGFDPLGYKAKFSDKFESIQLRELKNGRFVIYRSRSCNIFTPFFRV